MLSLRPCRAFPALAICLLALASPRATAADEAMVVRMVNNAYLPDTLTVSVGSTVRFVNDDPEIHTATQTGGFDSGLIFPGESWQYTFTAPGEYQYVCLPHPFMVGTIVVQ
ncbi:MAG: cupredoxin domain-containing protein [Chloroflexi bacterium]|nr:cupredoxin domain-containing protein [Chloroflexota bacterium]